MLDLVRHTRACPRFSKITKQQYLWEGSSYFVYLLREVTHPWKLQCYYFVLVGMFKVLWTSNHQYLWKWFSDFVDILQVVICVLFHIHWSYKNMLCWACIVRHILSTYQIVRCFKLKNLENNRMYQVDFLLPLKLQ